MTKCTMHDTRVIRRDYTVDMSKWQQENYSGIDFGVFARFVSIFITVGRSVVRFSSNASSTVFASC